MYRITTTYDNSTVGITNNEEFRAHIIDKIESADTLITSNYFRPSSVYSIHRGFDDASIVTNRYFSTLEDATVFKDKIDQLNISEVTSEITEVTLEECLNDPFPAII